MMQPEQLHDQSWNAMGEVARPEEVEHFLFALIMNTLGMPGNSRWKLWLKRFLGSTVRGISEKAATFDESVGRLGFQASASNWLNQWVSKIEFIGEEQIPADQPLLIAANHPGTFDSLALTSILPRNDLKIVTAGNPFFRSLPNLRQHLIYATNDTHVRMATIRKALRHLSAGGSLLIFPSGRVDPDPGYFLSEAKQSLEQWSDSLELLLRKVPQSNLVVAINSGFVAPEFLRHPFARMHPIKLTRQCIAEFIQVIQMVLHNQVVSNQPKVLFSEPFSLEELAQSPRSFRERVLSLAASMMQTGQTAD